MAKLEFGIWDQYRYTELQAAASAADVYESHIRLAQLMEQVGFQHYYTIEHQGSFVGQIPSPTVLLTAIAQHTATLRLGTMIWQLPFHNPLRLAQEITMLDHLSRGRVEFGTGIGIHEHEFIRFGLDFSERQKMGEEALDIIKMAWTQERVTYHGKYWQFEEALPCPAPYQDPHPPIWAAAHSPPRPGLRRPQQLSRRPEHRHRRQYGPEVRLLPPGVERMRTSRPHAPHPPHAHRLRR